MDTKPRYTTIGGIPVRNLLSEEIVQEAIHRTQLGGEEIINYLGRSGWYADGAAVCEKVEVVICEQRMAFTDYANVNGEYGCEEIYIYFGDPVILGKNGVERIIVLELDSDNKKRFELSHSEVRTSLDMLLSY